MKFTIDEMWVEFRDGQLSGSDVLVSIINTAVEVGEYCGCNYWGDVKASLDTPWQAYLTICGAIRNATLNEPLVDGQIPENPAGYEPEGPRFKDGRS